MVTFDYTLDLQLQDTLREIDLLRSQILTFPIAPASELKLQWEGTVIRTWATLALSGYNIPKQHIGTLLAHPVRPTRSTRLIYTIRQMYDDIHESWRANPKAVHIHGLRPILTELGAEPDFRDLLEYLAQESAHPVIQASIAQLHIVSLSGTTDLGIIARLVHYLILTKYGYDVRGFVTPDRQWLKDAQTYIRLKDAYTADHHMTPWIAFMVESMRLSLEKLKEDITSSHFAIELPQTYWRLTDRQKEIIKLLASPGSTITNQKVQKRFRVSQITASRDLSHLSTLGIIFLHGKGRSVYYTKI